MALLLGCAAEKAQQGGAAVAAAGAKAEDAEALLAVGEEEAYGNDFEAYMGMLDGMYRQGAYFDELGLLRPAEYMYRAGAAAAGSLRLCLEGVLFLQGEGDSPEELFSGRLGDWDSLARLSPVSPYPDYFEGLIYQMQGDADRAAEFFARALTFPSWPEAGWDFSYLKMLDTQELYALRDALAATEGGFYACFSPSLAPVPRDQFNFSAEYLIALSGEALQAEKPELALAYAETALMADPFSGNAYAAAAFTAMNTGDAAGAAEYLNEGLSIAPDHEGLAKLLQIFNTAADAEVAQ